MNEQAPQASVETVAGSRAKVFISYSRKDLSFAQSLVEALTERGFDAFLDKTDIAPGEPWKERLGGLIAAADTVVFAISPDSVASTVCAWELDESGRLGKRLIPVVARRIPDADAPPALGRLNWVFCTESDDKDAALTAKTATDHLCKFIIVVDEDIDPSNIADVLWALGTRWDPETGTDIIRKTRGSRLDPLLDPDKRERGEFTASTAIIDACKPYYRMEDFPAVAKTSDEMMKKTLEKWHHILK